ncbi:MAG: glutamate ligase domain-containing protein, partial [Thermodesulfobacteriota bacterium]
AVLGDMLELGAYAPEAHRAAGRRAADLGIDVMIAAGLWAREVVLGAQGSPSPPKKTMAVSSSQEALDELMGELRKGDWILVKGSRGVAMERVVEGLIAKVGLRASDETDRQETGEGI